MAQWEQAIAAKDGELKYRQAKIDPLTHEMAVLKRWKFSNCSERLDPVQLSLLDKTIDADIATIELEFPWLVEAELLEQLSMARRINAVLVLRGFDGIARHRAD